MIENAMVGGFNRVEVIDHRTTGTKITDMGHRAFQGYGRMHVMLSVQDDGSTLKVFLADRESDEQVNSRRSP